MKTRFTVHSEIASQIEQMMEVECNLICTSPYQPRRQFSLEELTELKESIISIGILHPPVVREIVDEGHVRYELIAGERRWRAAQLAGLSKIPVVVRKSSNEEAAKATLIENIQRVDLDPIELALAFRKLIEIFEMTQEELAEKIGKKRSTIANYLRLLTLPDLIQKDLSRQAITMGHAKVILSLAGPELQMALYELIISRQLTVRQSKQVALQLVKNKTKKAPLKKDIYLKAIEEKLQEKLGTKITITHQKKGNGTIAIDYFGLENLSEILSKMEIELD